MFNNPNWKEANHLAIYKHAWLRIWTWNKPRTNPASGQGRNQTPDQRIVSPMPWPLGHAASSKEISKQFRTGGYFLNPITLCQSRWCCLSCRVFCNYCSMCLVAFRIYDMDNDGFISNGELFQVLKMMVGNNLKETQLQQIVDKTVINADKDGDGKISFSEFCAVSLTPLNFPTGVKLFVEHTEILTQRAQTSTL